MEAEPDNECVHGRYSELIEFTARAVRCARSLKFCARQGVGDRNRSPACPCRRNPLVVSKRVATLHLRLDRKRPCLYEPRAILVLIFQKELDAAPVSRVTYRDAGL